jgi:hypothetical protein
MNKNGVQTYSVVFRHYDRRFAITIRVEVKVKTREVWADEIHQAQIEATKVIANACDNMYLVGDHTDYEIIQTRRKHERIPS